MAVEGVRGAVTQTPPRWALPAILVLALALRLFHLGTESLWLDEGVSVRIARLPLADLIRAASSDVHPPLYYLLLHFWIRVFGDSEFLVRLPSVVFGWLSVLLVHRVGRKLFDGRVALAAALLVALSPFAIHYSQEARAYALLGLLALASFDAYVDGLGGWARGSWVRYLAASALLVYTHSFGWFVIIAQNLHLTLDLLGSRGHAGARMRAWVPLQLALVALFAPWAGALGHQVSSVERAFWVPVPTLISLVKTAWEYAGSGVLLVMLAALAGLALLASWAPARGVGGLDPTMRRSRALLVVAWLAVPVLFPFAISRLGVPIYVTRTTIASSFALYLLAADGILRLRLRSLALLAVTGLLVPALLDYYRPVHKDPWRHVVAAIERDARPGDLVLVHAGYNKPNVYDYYARRPDLEVMGFPIGTSEVSEATIRPLVAASVRHERVWLVLSRPNDPAGLITGALSRSHRETYRRAYMTRAYEPSRTRAFVGIEVVDYER